MKQMLMDMIQMLTKWYHSLRQWQKITLIVVVLILCIYWLLVISDISEWWHWSEWSEHIKNEYKWK